MNCPVHKTAMALCRTRYGSRWGCEVEGCTVACWNGDTSTPADELTRGLRHECHEAFDPLWRNKSRWKNRGAAYRWLRVFMDLPEDKAHVGMFDAAQCRKLLEELAKDDDR